MRIYKSHYPAPTLPKTSVFNYLFPDNPADSVLPRHDPDSPAFIDGLTGRILTRRELEDSALRLASGLQARGLGKGSTVLMIGPNSLDWIIGAFGLQAAGVCASPANTAFSPSEIAYQYNNSGSTAILADPAIVPAIEQARKEFHQPLADDKLFVLTSSNGGKYKTIHEIMGARDKAARFEGDETRKTAWLCYSSGTTGLPKGVMTSHFNMTSEIQAINLAYPKLVPNKDKILGILPMSHMYGLALLLQQPLTIGVPVVVYPKFDEISVLKGIEKYKITFAMAVPPIVLILYHSANAKNYDLTSLKGMQCGAAPMSGELCAGFEAKFPHCKIVQGWGLTESSVAITYGRTDQVEHRKSSVGPLLPTWEARIVDADGDDVEEGEIWARSPAVMEGYHNNPEATAKTMAPGGWFKTGDVGRLDKDEFFYIVDRVKELIKYKGYQVPPAELEALLLQCPDVKDAGVVGVWSESQVTELPRAYVVANPGVTPKAIADWVAERVASHKRLRGGVVIVDAIPKSPSGKILRKDLRARAQKEFKDVDRARL